jgi:hypothetical protein
VQIVKIYTNIFPHIRAISGALFACQKGENALKWLGGFGLKIQTKF